MGKTPAARWWILRRAQNRKPATYRCPLCGELLPSLSEHTLMVPEGDASMRRHAHTACVVAARKRDQLPTRNEYLRTRPREPTVWRRFIERIAGRAG